MNLNNLLCAIKSQNIQKRQEALLELRKRSKSAEDTTSLYNLEFGDTLLDLLDEENGKYNIVILSIFANCTNVNENWRQLLIGHESFMKLKKNIIKDASDAGVISRVARLFANLAKSPECISVMEHDRPLIQSLVLHSSPPQNSKCKQACLRALRNICCSKQSAQMAVEDDKFPNLLSCLNSSSSLPEETDLILSCAKLVCELLKTQAIEVGFRMVEESVLKSLFNLGDHPSEEVRYFVLEIMFQLTVTTRCRVAVATEGAIELFLKHIRQHNDKSNSTESFKFAIQGLCLCAREAVSRNLMKSVGALQEMVRVLKNNDFTVYREALVAAFVWFLFDDSSLGLLIRADVTPSLLDYLDKLTLSEYRQAIELNTSTSLYDHHHRLEHEYPSASSPDSHNLNTSTDIGGEGESFSSRWMYPSSPESSPYNHYSPSSPNHYNACSPSSVSLTYSPPHSPMLPASPPDGYSDVLNESYGTDGPSSLRRKKIIPYHFQSADGIHAMIHGTRGPIHDTLLLLSRFSQAKDPSSFFLYLPGFNSLLNHVSLSVKPNPKCARLLNRLTSNSYCFDVLLRKNLIPRLYLRLCTGWSLEHLTAILDDARQEYLDPPNTEITGNNTNIDRCSNSTENPTNSEADVREFVDDGIDILYLLGHRGLPNDIHRMGKLFLSNLQMQGQTAYGSGVLSKILSTGSRQLQETCLISLPYIIWSKKLCHKLMIDEHGFRKLMELLGDSLSRSSETFVMIVESVCALVRYFQDYLVQTTSSKYTSEFEPPKKKVRLEEKEINPPRCIFDASIELCLPSGLQVKCGKDFIQKNSKIFDRMLDPIYTESSKSYATISDVNEDAFIIMIHFMHECEIDINYTTIECVTCRYQDHKIVSKEEKTQWRFVMDLLACAERFFVHDLKTLCEKFLSKELSDENVGEVFLLSCWNNCEILIGESLLYLLTKLKCPKLRTQYFAEVLLSHEKNNFLERIKSLFLSAMSNKY